MSDLKKASKVAPNDEAVLAALKGAEAELSAAGGAPEEPLPPEEEDVAPAPASTAGMGPGMDAAAQQMMNNPEMLKTATKMMQNMTDEQLEAMMANMPGGGPPGMSPEMAKMGMKMMKAMDPDTMEQMVGMASKMQQGGDVGGPGAAGPASQDAMMKQAEKMMEDPEMMKGMEEILQKMDPEQLKAMSAQAGVQMTDEQAAQAASVVKRIKPWHIKLFMKGVVKPLRSAAGAVGAATAFARRQPLVAGAFFVAIVALLFRRTLTRMFAPEEAAAAVTQEEEDPLADTVPGF